MRQLSFLCFSLAAVLLCCAACLCVQGCSAADRALEAKMLTMGADECVQIATAAGRKDVATYCGITRAGGEVLQQALADQVCTLPTDAGADH